MPLDIPSSKLYLHPMVVEQDILARRAQRQRRHRVRLAVVFAGLVSAVALMASLPDESALAGVVVFVLNGGMVAASLWSEQSDEWQRGRALLAIGAAFFVTAAWHVAHAVWNAIDGSHDVDPGRTLALMAVAWLLADFLLRQRTAGDDEQ